MSARSREEMHGLSPREQQIMDRLDAGMGRDAVAAELGVARSYVDFCNANYGPNIGAKDVAREQAVRNADFHYRRALRASGGCFR